MTTLSYSESIAWRHLTKLLVRISVFSWAQRTLGIYCLDWS